MKRSWLIEARLASGKTQEEVATMCGQSRQAICMYELSMRRPSPEAAKKIAEVLDFDWTKFYEQDSLQKTLAHNQRTLKT